MENYFKMNMDKQQINAISNLGLAHIGDGVFELLCRSYLCAKGGKNVGNLHRDTINMVKATSQAKFIDKLLPHLTEEELAQWEGKIVYIEYEGTTERVPVALDISETAFAKDCMPMYGPYFFTVVYTTPRLQETRDFFDYLLAWEENKVVTEPTG